MDRFNTGDTIEHELMPGFPMTIQEVADCEVDANRDEPHAQYKITDPEGAEDWLCAQEVRRVRRG